MKYYSVLLYFVSEPKDKKIERFVGILNIHFIFKLDDKNNYQKVFIKRNNKNSLMHLKVTTIKMKKKQKKTTINIKTHKILILNK